LFVRVAEIGLWMTFGIPGKVLSEFGKTRTPSSIEIVPWTIISVIHIQSVYKGTPVKNALDKK
jgi:hypothetical protein